jgi:hypothetical protein
MNRFRAGWLRRCPATTSRPSKKWAGPEIQNGELLRLAAAAFDVFLTPDRNLPFQQNLTEFPIAVVVLVASSNRLESLRELIPALLEVFPKAVPGEALRVGGGPE